MIYEMDNIRILWRQAMSQALKHRRVDAALRNPPSLGPAKHIPYNAGFSANLGNIFQVNMLIF